jgi:hypothetical protein
MNVMPKPDHFMTVVTCPECGRTGTATWEENENSDDADTATVLKNVSNGFRSDSDVAIYCIDCVVNAIVGRTSP